ncbi:MAG: hypothetical protein AAF542_01585 [Pseudomonadota bacterium]
METYNPFRILKNLFVDFLLKFTGTFVGAPQDHAGEEEPEAHG